MSKTFYNRNKIDKETGKVISSERYGKWNTLFIQKHYLETTLDFHYPVVNTKTGAIAILKVTMRSLPQQPVRRVHTEGGESYCDLPVFDVESVSLCSPVPFVQEFGMSLFDELPNRTLDVPTVYSWPNSLPAEVQIYKRNIVQVDDTLDSMFTPILQPDMVSHTGHFVPYKMKAEHLCPE